MRIENILNDYYRDRRTRTSEVRNFLHRLGIKPIRAKDAEALFRKQTTLFREAGRIDLAESFQRLGTPEELIAFARSDLLAAKIVLGGDFERILAAGEFVSRISLDPGSRIIDIGGGLGQLSLWMAHMWPNTKITLIEKASLDLPRRWAKDLGVSNVEFVHGAFEDVQLETGAFDLAVLSSFFGSLLPERHSEFTRAAFLASSSARASIAKITPIAQKLAVTLKPRGTVLVVDGLNETRILPLAKAFANEGFVLQTRYMEPRTGVGEFVALGFSRTEKAPGDGALSASTFLSLNDKTLEVTDGAAESLRELFHNAEPLLSREASHEGVKLKVGTRSLLRDWKQWFPTRRTRQRRPGSRPHQGCL